MLHVASSTIQSARGCILIDECPVGHWFIHALQHFSAEHLNIIESSRWELQICDRLNMEQNILSSLGSWKSNLQSVWISRNKKSSLRIRLEEMCWHSLFQHLILWEIWDKVTYPVSLPPYKTRMLSLLCRLENDKAHRYLRYFLYLRSQVLAHGTAVIRNYHIST